jgi:hypothetical protein
MFTQPDNPRANVRFLDDWPGRQILSSYSSATEVDSATPDVFAQLEMLLP